MPFCLRDDGAGTLGSGPNPEEMPTPSSPSFVPQQLLNFLRLGVSRLLPFFL